jgi:hypothetical protein
MGPFFGSNLDRSGRPETDDPKDWERYAEELQEAVISRTDYEHADIGTALLAIKSGARGRAEHLRRWIGAAGNFVGPDGALIPVRTSLSEGLSFDALRAEAVGSHRGLVRFFDETAAFGKEFREARMTRGFNALARAMRSPEPGVVFARAAAVGDTDPLADLDSRLFVGLKP